MPLVCPHASCSTCTSHMHMHTHTYTHSHGACLLTSPRFSPRHVQVPRAEAGGAAGRACGARAAHGADGVRRPPEVAGRPLPMQKGLGLSLQGMWSSWCSHLSRFSSQGARKRERHTHTHARARALPPSPFSLCVYLWRGNGLCCAAVGGLDPQRRVARHPGDEQAAPAVRLG